MSLKLGNIPISGISQNTKYNAHHLLDFKWTDCIMNDVSWLRADTFSWQSGDVYTSAYNHLVADLQGATVEYDGKHWTQPVLTANGTLGGSSFAVSASSEYSSSYQAYMAFDSSTSSEWATQGTHNPSWITFYNPNPLNVTLLTMRNRTSAEAFAGGNIYGSNDNSTWELLTTYTSSNTVANATWTIDLSSNTNYYNYYKIEGTSFTGTNQGFTNIAITATEQIEYYRATDGHKICLADQEQTIANVYSETGIAWYYIVDTNNTRFKLPRTKYGFEGLRNNVGDLIPQDVRLPNITSNGYNLASPAVSVGQYGAITVSSNPPARFQGAGSTYILKSSLDASLVSPVYSGDGTNTKIQPPATQMYLYFYVGDYSQTAIEQTAGLNSDLFNSKADVDLSNINPSQSTKNEIVTWGMPDYSSAIDISSYGTSSNKYTAPCDGYIIASAGATGGSYMWVHLYNSSDTLINVLGNRTMISGSACASNITLLLPKGYKVFVEKSGNSSEYHVEFYPLKGVN